MIFVTVGTHEQPFDRLVREVDKLKREAAINETIFIQTGYSTYHPEKCDSASLIRYNEMTEYIKKARIVITHGGPGSIMPVIYCGKIPIVVPRQKKFGEHVDNHQVYFTQRLEKMGRILAVYDIRLLEKNITCFDELIRKISVNLHSPRDQSKYFAKMIDEICKNLIKK